MVQAKDKVIDELRKKEQEMDEEVKVTKGQLETYKVSKGAKIRNLSNQVPYPTQDTNGKVTNSQLDTTN